MKTVHDLLNEHFELPQDRPTIICKHCGMDGIWSLTKHLTMQHGIDVSGYTFSRTPDPATSDDYGRKIQPADGTDQPEQPTGPDEEPSAS